MTEFEIREYYEDFINGYEFEELNRELLLDKLIEGSKIVEEKEIEYDIDDMLILLFDMKDEGYLYIEDRQEYYIDTNIITFVKYEISNLFTNENGKDVDIYELISEYL